MYNSKQCRKSHHECDVCFDADAVLAERGEVAVTVGELNDLRALAANGADTAELAQETANLISLLHQARSSNAQVSVLPNFY